MKSKWHRAGLVFLLLIRAIFFTLSPGNAQVADTFLHDRPDASVVQSGLEEDAMLEAVLKPSGKTEQPGNQVTVTGANCCEAVGEVTISDGDGIPPTPVCNDITIQLDGTGNYTLTQADIAAIGAGSTDNCTTPANLTLSVSPGSFICDDLTATIPNDYAVETDGVNDYLDMGDLNGAFDFADQATIQVWMRPLSNLSNYQSYVESNNGGTARN